MDHLIPSLDRSLLAQTEPVKKHVPQGFWLLLVVEIISVLAAGAAGYLWHKFIGGEALFSLAVAAGVLFLAMSSLAALLGGSVRRRAIVILLEAGAFLFGWGVSSEYLGVALAVILVFSMWGDSSLREELKNRLKIRLIPLVRMKVGHTFTGFLLAGIILTIPVWKDSNLPLPEKQFKYLYASTVQIAGVLNPDIKMDSSIYDLAAGIARKQLVAQEGFNSLSEEDQEREVRIAAEALIKQAEGSLKLSVKEDSSSADVLYQYMARTFADWQASFGPAFSLLLALGLFIFLRGIGIIMAWMGMLLSMLVFEALSFSGIVAVIGEPAMQEKVVMIKG